MRISQLASRTGNLEVDANSILRVSPRISVILALASILRLATIPPASHYEISIYASIPADFWILGAGSILLASAELVAGSFRHLSSLQVRTSVLGAILGNLALMSAPLFQEYFTLGRGDVLTHYGIVQGIVSSGSIPSNLFYPADHFILSFMTITGHTPIGILFVLWPAICGIFFLLGTFLLCRALLKKESDVLLVTGLFAFLPVGIGQVLMTAPSIQAFMVLPFTLFLLVRSFQSRRRVTYSLSLIPVLIAMVFFHPLDAVLLIIVSATLLVAIRWGQHSRVVSRMSIVRSARSIRASRGGICLALLFVVFAGWYSSFRSTSFFIAEFLDAFLGNAPSTPEGIYAGYLSSFHPGTWVIVQSIVKVFGLLVFYSVLGSWLSIRVLRSYVRSPPRAYSSHWTRLFLVASFWIFLILTGLGFFAGLLVGTRYSKDFSFFALIVIGLGLSDLLARKTISRGVIAIGLAAILVSLSCMATIQIYRSPITFDPSEQVTHMEASGAEWFFEYRDNGILTGDIGFGVTRFSDAFAGPQTQINRSIEIPHHFGYPGNTSLEEALGTRAYLIISKLGRDWYPVGRAGMGIPWLWTPSDFVRLEMDGKVERLFDNGDVQVYSVN